MKTANLLIDARGPQIQHRSGLTASDTFIYLAIEGEKPKVFFDAREFAVMRAKLTKLKNGVQVEQLERYLKKTFKGKGDPLVAIAIVILKEKTGKNFALWATIGVIASYFLTFGFNLPNVNADKNTIIAALLAVLAAFSFAVGTVFGKKIATKLDFVTVTYYRYGITSLLMFFYLIFNYPKLLLILNLSSKIWMIFWIIPLTTGIGAMFLYFYGLKNVNATVSTICELFFPISALFLDYLVNGIILSPIQIISAAVMIFAVTMLIFQHQNYKKTKAKANAR